MRIFNMRYKLAKEYAAISQEKWERFDRHYRPLENTAIAECMAAVPATTDYPAVKNRIRQFSQTSVAGGRSLAASYLKRYALCMDPSLEATMEMGEAGYSDDLTNLGYRDAESYRQAIDDIRWNRRANLLNLGRDTVSQAATYGRTASTLLEGAANSQAQTTAGAISYLGYYRDREITAYPNYLAHSVAPGMIMSNMGGSGTGIAPMSIDSTG
jgi:hypothetical protein